MALKQALRTVNIRVDELVAVNVTGFAGGPINIHAGPHQRQSSRDGSRRSPIRNRSPAKSGSRLSKSPGQHSNGGTNDQRIQKLEAMISKMNCSEHGFTRPQAIDNNFHSSFGTLE